MNRPSPLRLRRLHRGLRLRDLADAVRVNDATLGALERGDRNFDPRSLRALSVFYQTDAARLEAEMARWREQRGPRLPWVRNSGAWVRA